MFVYSLNVTNETGTILFSYGNFNYIYKSTAFVYKTNYVF